MENIIEILAATTGKYPDKVAAICEDEECTYRELSERVRRFSAELRERFDVGPDDRVAILMPNCLEFIVVYLGIVRTGAVALPVNIRLKAPEIEFILKDAGVRMLVAHSQTWVKGKEALAGLPDVEKVVSVGFTDDGSVGYDDLMTGNAPDFDVPRMSGSDVAAIIYTSGTTGLPKGAMLTHDNLIFNSYSCVAGFGFRHEEVHLVVVPLFHVTGLNTILITSLRIGSTLVISAKTGPADIIRLIEKHRVNTFFGVPTTYVMFVASKRIAEADLSSARIFVYSGAPMPPDTIRKLRELFPNLALVNLYGLTETTSVTTVLPSEEAENRIESVGKAVPDLELQVIDDEGQALPPGQVGELCVRGRSVLKGYFNRPEATQEAFLGEWFRTGDYAALDEEGYVFLKGRKKEMIIVAGENVYPVEVENAICSNEKVLEAAAVGVDHPVMGQVVKAAVAPKPGCTLSPAEVKRHCTERLASFKVPHVVEILDRLPRNPSGKVVKRELV